MLKPVPEQDNSITYGSLYCLLRLMLVVIVGLMTHGLGIAALLVSSFSDALMDAM